MANQLRLEHLSAKMVCLWDLMANQSLELMVSLSSPHLDLTASLFLTIMATCLDLTDNLFWDLTVSQSREDYLLVDQ